MKNTLKILLISSAALLASSCVKETFPTSIATSEQIGKSASALEALVNAISAQMCAPYPVYNDQVYEYDMGYPGMMIITDTASGDIVDSGETGYDWYSFWSSPHYNIGPNAGTSYVPWRTYYMFIKSANDVIGAVDPASANETQKHYLAYACCYRALFYLNLVRMYEFKAATDPGVAGTYTPENDINGLTVPLVTDKTKADEAKNNPRVTVEKAYELIFSDLDAAEKYLEGTSSSCSLFPSYAVACGLKARAYLERGSAGVEGAFAKAAEYADKALTAFGGTPLTQDQWEDPINGFNNAAANATSWMWYIGYDAENMGNLCTFVAHMSNENTWTAYGWNVGRGIPRSLYESIPDTDFRKHSWIDPKGDAYYKYQLARKRGDAKEDPYTGSKAFGGGNYAYCSIKFRPASGECNVYKTGGATQIPLMRMEEMILIKAEALALSGDLAGGKDALNSLIKTRNPEYSCSDIASASLFQDEVYKQKRIELWGEGLIYFDAKRLSAGFRNGYSGTNAQGGYKYNCTGVAPWWNFVIPQAELNGNPVLQGYNNPDPTNVVNEWVGE